MMANKRILNFKVSGQKIEKNGNFSHLAKGTRGYLRAAFDCSAEWDRCMKAAVFFAGENEYPVPIVNCECDVPDEAAAQDIWGVKLVGEKDGFRITTNKVEVVQI